MNGLSREIHVRRDTNFIWIHLIFFYFSNTVWCISKIVLIILKKVNENNDIKKRTFSFFSVNIVGIEYKIKWGEKKKKQR